MRGIVLVPAALPTAGCDGEGFTYGGMTERSDRLSIVGGAAEDPAPRSPVKPQETTTVTGALGGQLLRRRPGRVAL